MPVASTTADHFAHAASVVSPTWHPGPYDWEWGVAAQRIGNRQTVAVVLCGDQQRYRHGLSPRLRRGGISVSHWLRAGRC